MHTMLAFLVVTVLSGCQAVPSMKYCDEVSYTRSGSKIHIEAECTAPIGSSIPGL